MSALTSFDENLQMAIASDDPGGQMDFPLMPLGEAVDMGRAADGRPLLDPRILHSAEFLRNPYPYYRILRDHHPLYYDQLHNTYYVTRYEDVTSS